MIRSIAIRYYEFKHLAALLNESIRYAWTTRHMGHFWASVRLYWRIRQEMVSRMIAAIDDEIVNGTGE